MRKILITVAVLAAVVAAATVPARATSTSSAAAAAQASSNVAVIPGFTPPAYPGFNGVPPFPTGSFPQYHFSPLAAGSVTTAALQSFDTVVLYGIKWADLSPTAQAAINQFALTGKVLIWDSDATGSQSYSTFVHPFVTQASGEVHGQQQSTPAVTFPSGSPLASPDSSSPLFLDPNVLTASSDLLVDMSIQTPGAANWNAGLIASNATFPSGGWILAWAYGDTAKQTGLTIYSGMDADSFTDKAPNYAIKELGIELGAQFSTSAGGSGGGGGGGGGGTGGGGGSGLGGSGGQTFASCTFAHVPKKGWVRGTVIYSLAVSNATGIRGEVVSSAGKVVGSAAATAADGTLNLNLDTKKLPSNVKSALTVNVYVNTAKACSLTGSLSVDNIPAKLPTRTVTHKSAKRWTLTLKSNETVHGYIYRQHKVLRAVILKAGKKLTVSVKASPTSVVLIDRAGNTSRVSLLKP